MENDPVATARGSDTQDPTEVGTLNTICQDGPRYGQRTRNVRGMI